MSDFMLELNNISKSYQDGDSKIDVLKDINLNVKPGEFVAIVGPSGSGKSTLLSIAGALLSPSEGKVVIGGKQISSKRKEWTNVRRDQIGFIFQTHQLMPFLTVLEQLELVAIINKKNKNKVRDEAISLLKDLGLENRIDIKPSKLSGGERQRVAIARAFMNNPDVILADEPTASLDGVRGRQVVEMIKNQTKKYNKAAVMVTHDERVLDLVDCIYRIENGKIKKC